MILKSRVQPASIEVTIFLKFSDNYNSFTLELTSDIEINFK